MGNIQLKFLGIIALKLTNYHYQSKIGTIKVKSEAGECEVLINTPRIRLGEYLSPVR